MADVTPFACFLIPSKSAVAYRNDATVIVILYVYATVTITVIATITVTVHIYHRATLI